VPEGLFEVRDHEDTIAMLLFDLGLETALLDGNEVVVEDARAEHNLWGG